MARVYGGGASLLIGATSIPIRKLAPKFSNNAKDSTDSSNYNSSNQVLYRDMEPGKMQMELEVDFNFSTTHTQSQIIDNFTTGTVLTLTVFAGINQDTGVAVPFCYGDFLITEADLEIDVNEGTNVTGKCTMVNKGPWSTSAPPGP